MTNDPKELTTEQKLALAWDDISQVEGAEEKAYDTYGMWTVTVDGYMYAMGTDEEANKACAEYIKGSVWAFNAPFLAHHIGIPDWAEKALQEYQCKQCEDCNDELLDRIDDLPHFIAEAIAADGRGHFLSQYDGQELELPNGLYAYRID